MLPKQHCKPVRYLYDDFDGTYPWHCYWDLRFADSAFPANDTGSGVFHSIPLRGWTIGGSKLTFPDYTWLVPTPSQVLSKNLFVKIDKVMPPYTFQLAFKFSTLVARSGFDKQLDVIGVHGLGAMNNAGVADTQWTVSPNVPGASGNSLFAVGSFAENQDIYYRFEIDATYHATWDFKVNGVTPALAPGPQTWPVGTSKLVNAAAFNSSAAFYLDHYPLRFYPGNAGGSELEYLEIKLDA